jgi:hypothetical protein
MASKLAFGVDVAINKRRSISMTKKKEALLWRPLRENKGVIDIYTKWIVASTRATPNLLIQDMAQLSLSARD